MVCINTEYSNNQAYIVKYFKLIIGKKNNIVSI